MIATEVKHWPPAPGTPHRCKDVFSLTKVTFGETVGREWVGAVKNVGRDEICKDVSNVWNNKQGQNNVTRTWRALAELWAWEHFFALWCWLQSSYCGKKYKAIQNKSHFFKKHILCILVQKIMKELTRCRVSSSADHLHDRDSSLQYTAHAFLQQVRV